MTTLRLAELIAALSLATDLGTGQPIEQGWRTSLVALRFADVLGLADAERRDVYYLALLRYLGCTADADLAASVFGDDIAVRRWIMPASQGGSREILAASMSHIAEEMPLLQRVWRVASAMASFPKMMNSSRAHCEAARLFAGRFGFEPRFLDALDQMYEFWNGGGVPNKLRGDQLARSVRVVQVAMDAEMHTTIGGWENAEAVLRRRAGKALDPNLVARFCAAAPDVLAPLEDEASVAAVLEAEPRPWRELRDRDLEMAARTIGEFADLKSPHMSGHSTAVARLARGAAERLGLPAAETDQLALAGYLHDVGRVGVTDSIWCKSERLTPTERERIRLYPYYTDRVLAHSPALSRFGSVASLVQERGNGSGYHRGLAASAVSQPGRILAAADVYQALVESRPYRPAFSATEAAAELDRAATSRLLDPDAVAAVLDAAGHRRTVRHERPAGLSDREVEVLALIARGLSIRQIADRLVIAPKTADRHIQNIYTKIGVSTRAAATVFAMQHDLLQPEFD